MFVLILCYLFKLFRDYLIYSDLVNFLQQNSKPIKLFLHFKNIHKDVLEFPNVALEIEGSDLYRPPNPPPQTPKVLKKGDLTLPQSLEK